MDVVEGWDPSWMVTHEFFVASFPLVHFLCGKGTGACKGCFPQSCGKGWALAAWRHQLYLGEASPAGRVGGGSPTLAPKFKGSLLTRDFKLCFKAKQHPWARDGGFYLGPNSRSHRSSCWKLFYRWSWIKGSGQTVHDTVFMACVIWKYYST